MCRVVSCRDGETPAGRGLMREQVAVNPETRYTRASFDELQRFRSHRDGAATRVTHVTFASR